MKDLIEALQIFLKYMPDVAYPTWCHHDMLHVACPYLPDEMPEADVERLSSLGFHYSNENGWYSTFYGSC